MTTTTSNTNRPAEALITLGLTVWTCGQVGTLCAIVGLAPIGAVLCLLIGMFAAMATMDRWDDEDRKAREERRAQESRDRDHERELDRAKHERWMAEMERESAERRRRHEEWMACMTA